MNTVDALCKGCGRPIRWSCGTAILCSDCNYRRDEEKASAPLAGVRLGARPPNQLSLVAR